MRRLRLRLVQRLVAVVLLAGFGAAWAPTAEARAAHADAGALVAALDAAATAATFDAAAAAFSAAYVAHGGTPAEAVAVFDALLADGFGAPDPLAEAFVPGRLAAPAPPTRTLSAAPTSVADMPAPPAPTAHCVAVSTDAVPPPRRSPRSPRAP